MGFRRVVFLNQAHYRTRDTYAIAYACAAAAPRPARRHPRLPDQLLGRVLAEEAAEFFDPSNGLHADAGETPAVIGDQPGPRRPRRPTTRCRAFPR